MSTSVGNNQNPWSPYDTYKDCSQGICSIYCPQWCYIIFPPPPPFSLEDDSGTAFSPLIIAVIGILASAFILVTYYTIISKYCRRRHDETGLEFSENRGQISTNEAGQLGNNVGLDEELIKTITVCKYKKGDGLVEGTDCSVCLSEFQEDESLRLLPKCNHAFHIPCIDTWLKFHSSCPLCRAKVASMPPAAAAAVLVMQDIEHGVNDGEAVANDQDDNMIEVEVQAALPVRRSVSLNSSLCQGPALVGETFSTNDEEDEDEIQLESIEKNVSGRSRVMNLVRNSPLALKRSISTGRFMFTRYESKSGNSVIIPN